MQELLCTVDMLITDYSSCMFDFALSGKPCLQFATDIESYRQDRNFYFPLDRLPSPWPAATKRYAKLYVSWISKNMQKSGLILPGKISSVKTAMPLPAVPIGFSPDWAERRKRHEARHYLRNL